MGERGAAICRKGRCLGAAPGHRARATRANALDDDGMPTGAGSWVGFAGGVGGWGGGGGRAGAVKLMGSVWRECRAETAVRGSGECKGGAGGGGGLSL